MKKLLDLKVALLLLRRRGIRVKSSHLNQFTLHFYQKKFTLSASEVQKLGQLIKDTGIGREDILNYLMRHCRCENTSGSSFD